MNLQPGDSLATVARISAADLRRVGATDENKADPQNQKPEDAPGPEPAAEDVPTDPN